MDEHLLKILQNEKSWPGISAAIRKINGENPVVAGKLFEHFCKSYYRYFYKDEFEHVWPFEEIPSNLRARLGLSSTDYGIDLLIQTPDKKYLAVQCKFRDDENSIISWSKDKLANLFAEGNKCDDFIIFTNASGVDAHSLAKHENRLTVVTCEDIQERLNKTTIPLIVQMLRENRVVRAKHFPPLGHQKKAIAEVINGFKKNDRGKLILPCGAGKTLAALWIKEKLEVQRTLVLVPSLALLRQFHESWKEQQKTAPDYLCVCSEKDIDKGADSNVSHLYELQAPGRVTTDPKAIRAFLRKSGPRIIYSTYQSSPQIAHAIRRHKLSFDLAICDEAHKTAGDRKHSAFATILDDKKIPCKKRLFMTATPRVVSAVVKNRLGDQTYEYVADMNDAGAYGPELYRMTFAEAIKKKILVDYKIIAVGITDKELQRYIQERRFVKGTTIDEVASNYALADALRKYKCRHAVSFHSNVKKAKQFRERHASLCSDTQSFHINGEKTTKERKQILRDFKQSPKALVTNARCLTEGVDVPAIDAVYFCDPKYSKIDIVQAAGRALRQDREKDKEFGHIFIPIYHNKADDLEEHLNSGVFNQLVRVVRAMSDQDERIEEEIRQIVYGEGERKLSQRRIRIDVDRVKLIEISGFEKKLKQSIFFDVIRKTFVPYRPFEQAREFARELQLKSFKEWIAYCHGELKEKPEKPDDIPMYPNRTYEGKGWKSMGDWFGTGTVAFTLKQWRPFRQARLFVHRLQLKSNSEWQTYCRGELRNKPKKPDDIPAAPHVRYAKEGWVSLGDWLGTNVVATNARRYRSFKESRRFVHKLKLKSGTVWRLYLKGKLKNKPKKPDDIPHTPERTYKDSGWKGMGDWLGTGTIAPRLREYQSFQEARKFAHRLELKSRTEWEMYCHGKMPNKPAKPKDIPANVRQTYKSEGWKGWGDWLGTGTLAPRFRRYRSFKEARTYVHALRLKSWTEWLRYCHGEIKGQSKKPEDIPVSPDRAYQDKGWKGVGDWLGTGSVANFLKEYRAFVEARSFVRGLKLKSESEWRRYCRGEMKDKPQKPDDIPVCPGQTYKNKGWKGMGDWLGTFRIADQLKKYREFKDARAFVRKLKLKSQEEWFAYCHGELSDKPEKPDDIPVCPYQTYKNKGWVWMGDWLGTGLANPRFREYRPFKEARTFVHKLKLKTRKEWNAYCCGAIRRLSKKPDDIPQKPERMYKDKGWRGVGDWLGTGAVANFLKKYRSFEKARSFVHKLKLQSHAEWLAYCRGEIRSVPKKPDDIPSYPVGVYANKGWEGVGDWLGNK